MKLITKFITILVYTIEDLSIAGECVIVHVKFFCMKWISLLLYFIDKIDKKNILNVIRDDMNALRFI